MIKQLTTIQLTPSLDSPHYTVLKKTKEYEIRQYSPYLVAETNMPSDARPAGGDGFTDLAGYIFGGNSRYADHASACFVCECMPVVYQGDGLADLHSFLLKLVNRTAVTQAQSLWIMWFPMVRTFVRFL